jgi:hypothetical protein
MSAVDPEDEPDDYDDRYVTLHLMAVPADVGIKDVDARDKRA